MFSRGCARSFPRNAKRLLQEDIEVVAEEGRELEPDSRGILSRTGPAPVPKPIPLPPPGFDDLSVDEKIDYLQALWDRIAATPETIPVPDWHREIIDERVKELDVDPDAGDDWDVVKERLRKKFDNHG